MERKLEQKDVAGYLPYGLFTYVGTPNTEYSLLEAVSNNFIVFHFKSNRGFENTATIDDIKPILRPLSDLYHTITHNGKEIVPIVELAKRAFKRINDWELKGNGAHSRKHKMRFRYNNNYSDKDRCGYFSSFSKDINQYQLFDYLHELKIDYRGLIEAGLAIDCNTLDINPYK